MKRNIVDFFHVKSFRVVDFCYMIHASFGVCFGYKSLLVWMTYVGSGTSIFFLFLYHVRCVLFPNVNNCVIHFRYLFTCRRNFLVIYFRNFYIHFIYKYLCACEFRDFYLCPSLYPYFVQCQDNIPL